MRRLEDRVEVKLNDIGCENVDWIEVTQNRAQ
jgi:hypothetical protein